MRFRWDGRNICIQVFIEIFLLHYSYSDNKTCLDPGVSRDGKREGNCCSLGDELRFSCFEDCELVGLERIVCLSNATWSSERPLCKPLKDHCDLPPAVPHGIVVGNKFGDYFLPNDEAEIMCEPGYKYNGSTQFVKCEKGGKWKDDFGECTEIISCPDPSVSKDGKREGKCCSSGDELLFSCFEGYELVGHERIVCLANATWSSKRPLCKPLKVHCDLPPAVPHGIVIGNKYGDYFLPNDEAEILCEPGYKYNGSTYFIMCEEGGIWEDIFEECTVIKCDRPAALINGVIPELLETEHTQFPHKFQITYRCNDGYRILGGDSWSFCGEHGWSGRTPYCEEIRCPDPGIPENGDRVLDSLRIGGRVRFSCFSGYDLLGSVERYCKPNGQWTGQLTRCNAPSNYCPNPGIPINGFKSSAHYDFEDTVTFRCHPGYIQVGSEVRECWRDGTWSGTETKCLSPYDFDNSVEAGQYVKEGLANILAELHERDRRYEVLSRGLPGCCGTFDMFRPQHPVIRQNERLILHFAFDVSGSVGEINFRKSIDFAKAVVHKVEVSRRNVHVGAVTFGSVAETVFLPMNFHTTEEVLAHLDSMNYTGGGTSASSALSLIRENIGIEEQDEYFGKMYKKDVVFIFTDGKTNMGGSPELEANVLKQMGVDIYCIGITGDPRIETLYKMATTTKYGNEERPDVFILENYSTMSVVIEEIILGRANYSKCGLGMENTVYDSKGKISDGKQKAGSWPWMAAIYFSDSEHDLNYELKCGGSIVHEYFILTAAHCLYETTRGSANLQLRDKGKMFVNIGRANSEGGSWIEEFEVENMHIHERYNPGNILEQLFDYDIALIQLVHPIYFSPSVRPICLPPKELPENSTLCKPNEYGWIAGWGHTGVVDTIFGHKIRYSISKDLQELYVPIQSDHRCIKSMENKNVDRKYFTDRMFCAGDGKVGNDVCKGDSGSPLMQPQMNSEGYLYWTQVGIVSWGIGCGMENTYGFYTHVQRLVSWIEDKINDFT